MIRSVVAVMLAVLAIGPAVNAEDRDGLAFFESKIRPVLVQECDSCHAATSKKLRGGLEARLASGDPRRRRLRAGHRAGKPEESLLMDALRHDGLEMPPKRRLPESVVNDFERWIRIGAPDPREGDAGPLRAGIDVEAGRSFWSYQTPHLHPAPAVRDEAWPSNDVDRFLLAALEARGLKPAKDADRAVLIRRIYDDLIGLPPTPEEVAAFEADGARDAYERLVDRLLASPRFGERWGRHWLDVARFGESLTLRGFVLKEAWRYRDYVINSFNDDLPFDRFLREQIAGDLLPADDLEDRRRMMAATTFLALGQHEPGRTGQGPARHGRRGRAARHDRQGVPRPDDRLRPVPRPQVRPDPDSRLLRDGRDPPQREDARTCERLPNGSSAPCPSPPRPRRRSGIGTRRSRAWSGRSRRPALGRTSSAGWVVDDAQAKRVGRWKTSQSTKPFLGDGYIHDEDSGKGEKTVTFDPDLPSSGTYEIYLAYTPGSNRSGSVPVTIFSARRRDHGAGRHARAASALRPLRLPRPLQIRAGRARFRAGRQRRTTGHVVADAAVFIPLDDPSLTARAAADSDRLRMLEAELTRRKSSGPKREMVLSVVEADKIGDTHVHIRGSVHNLGDPVPRGFLRVASFGDAPTLPTGESGRRELAEWLSDRRNPLTARVIVNRAWHRVFGEGLVRTVDNFGTTGELPSHPELLDDLAVRFMDGGWSIKRLVRTLVLSRAYRLSSSRPEAADPENRLLGHRTRRRRDAESIRDAILAASGELRFVGGGATYPANLSADYGYSHDDVIRSVYVPVFRNSLPEIFSLFDFADPSMVVGRRDVSTVAPQALYFLNHPFVAEQSRHAARRLLALPGLDEAGRIGRACQVVLGRPPDDAEAATLRRFLANQGDDEAAWAVVFQTLFASPDFRYVD